MSIAGQTRNNISKTYLADPERFAQICNNTLFGGRAIISPGGLHELDTHESKVMGIDRKEAKAIWKDRDLLRMYKEHCALAIIGIENQSDIHYCMPVRCFLYDALNYEEQRGKIKKAHDKAKDLKGAELLSGFSEHDRLIPVFTVVVYFGNEPWDGPKSLHEMLVLPDALKEYEAMLADYRINLLDIGQMQNLEQYDGELKAFFGFLKYRKDKKKLGTFIKENDSIFDGLSMETVQAISIMADVSDVEQYCERQKNHGERGIDMCQAWEEIKADERMAGREEGREEGIYALITDNLDSGNSKESILEKLKKYFLLDELTAQKYVDRYMI